MSAITRRDVFGLAALAAAGRLPLLGAGSGPVGAAPVRGYLGAHEPAAGVEKPSLLEYAVLRWTETDPATGGTKNVEIGRLEIEKLIGHGVMLKVRQRTAYPGPVNRLEAETVCNEDGWLTLRSWRVRSWIEGREDCLYEATGEIVGSRARVEDGISDRMIYNLPAAVTSQWALAMALASGKAMGGGFTLLEDLALVKPNQVLAEGPEVSVVFRDRAHRLKSWVHTGTAVLPIHYLVDEKGLPQLMTQGALAWALQRAE